jgi:3-dehydroquinate dehydratase-2
MPKTTSTRKSGKGSEELRKAILVLHGPNLNLLGSREPQHYGLATLEDINQALKTRGEACGVSVDSFQSNHEGQLIDRIQQAKRDGVDFILINPAGFTHTSVALRDAMAATGIPFVEVHLSNVHNREPFRRHSYFSDLALGVIAGLGSQGYELALEFALRHLHVKVASHGSQKTEKTH